MRLINERKNNRNKITLYSVVDGITYELQIVTNNNSKLLVTRHVFPFYRSP